MSAQDKRRRPPRGGAGLATALAGLGLALGAATAAVAGESPSAPSPLSQEVAWSAAGVSVRGSLTLPAAEAPWPAVLLIAGSGPSDRDWNSPGLAGTNGSGKLLAEALAGRGIAMLRYDKRGTGATPAHPPHRWADFEAEQVGGLALLAGYPGIDPGRLYVVGHSEGALHALRLAGRGDLPIAGLGLLAAPGRPLAEIVAGQFERGYAAAQAQWPAAERAAFRAMMAALASGGEAPVLPRGASPSLEALGQALFDSRERPFLAEIMRFEPLPAVRGLKLPLLVAGGLKDTQLEIGADLDALIAAALASASPRVSTHRVARADHMLKREPRPRSQLGQPGRPPDYNRPGRSLDPAIPAAIEAWIAGAGEPALSAGPLVVVGHDGTW